jgi:hypothetical protein
MRTDLRYQQDDGRCYETDKWADRDYTAVRRPVAAILRTDDTEGN